MLCKLTYGVHLMEGKVNMFVIIISCLNSTVASFKHVTIIKKQKTFNKMNKK